MENYNRTFFTRACLALTTMLVMAACSSGGTTAFPPIASPPPFDYADGEELRSGMHRLAFELQQLDLSLMIANSDQDQGERDQVVTRLDNIQRIGEGLIAGDLSTNHVFLSNDMSRFLSTVNRARMSAENNPPNYYQAGRVSGACVNCHRVSQ
jgi:hypothetical protein